MSSILSFILPSSLDAIVHPNQPDITNGHYLPRLFSIVIYTPLHA
jgi:hypothetical protein